MSTLKINQTISGFFSCSSIMLYQIIGYFDQFKCCPDNVDTSDMMIMFKKDQNDVFHNFFDINNDEIPFVEPIVFGTGNDWDKQYSDYSQIPFDKVNPLFKKYFTISKKVKEKVDFFTKKYLIDQENFCSVYYRGLDKCTEIPIATHEIFLEKCKEIKAKNPNIKFFVQTDEKDFEDRFKLEFPDSVSIEELIKLPFQLTHITRHIPIESRIDFAIDFLAATFIVSKCKILVTHTGNCGLWSVFLRGNFNNVFQYRDPYWIENVI